MKIAILALSPRGVMAHYSSQLANCLAEKNEVIVILPSNEPKHLYTDKIQMEYFLPRRFLKIPSPTSYFKLYKLISKINPDIIQDTISTYYWTAGIKPFLRKWPLAITVHNPKLHSGISFFLKFIYKYLIDKLHIKTADIIFVHGQRCKEDVVSLGVLENKVKVIPMVKFEIFDRGRDDLEQEKNTVLFFGYLRLNKGVDRLFEIAQIVKEKNPAVKFIVAGSSELKWSNKRKIKKIVQTLKSSDIFEVHDEFIPDDKVEIYFRRASVVLCPYHDATQSAIIPIAYAFSKPVVTTRVGDLPEIVINGETGYLCQPDSNEDIAQKIIELLKNEKQRKIMGEHAFRFALKNLSWENISNKIIDIYCQHIIKEKEG